MNHYLKISLFLIGVFTSKTVFAQKNIVEVPTEQKHKVFGLINLAQELRKATKNQRLGRGFYYEYNGTIYVITCAHIIQTAPYTKDDIKLNIEGKKHTLKLVGADTFLDIAVLEFEHTVPKNLFLSTFAKPNPNKLITINGVIKTGRIINEPYTIENSLGGLGCFEHNIPVEVGLSGSPVMQNGKVAGITNRIKTEKGKWKASYALDGLIAQKAIHDIVDSQEEHKKYGRVTRPWFNLMAKTVKKKGGELWIKLESITENKRRSSLLKGFHLCAINHKTVKSLGDILKNLNDISPNKKIRLTLQKDNDKNVRRSIFITTKQLRHKNYKQITKHFFKQHPKFKLVTRQLKDKFRYRLKDKKNNKIGRLQFAGFTHDFGIGFKYYTPSIQSLGMVLRMATLQGRINIEVKINKKERASWKVEVPNNQQWLYF